MRFPIAFLLALLPLVSFAQEPRALTGSLVYRERVALPPEGEMLVELRDDFGAVVARTAQPTDGAQVPLPFSIEAPAGIALELRAALRLDGVVRWLSAPVALEPDSQPENLGEILLAAFRPMGFVTKMSCGDVQAGLSVADQTARLRIGGTYLDLVAEPTASGARFAVPADPDTWIWTRGDSAMLSLDAVELPECRPLLPDAFYSVRGNEPGWTLVIEAGQMRYSGDYGATEISAALPEPQVTDAMYRFAPEGIDLALSLTSELCRDYMTGMPYPARALLETGGRSLRGCGGDPLDLLVAHPWRADQVAGSAVLDGSEVTLRFGGGGRLSGSTGCNRFNAGYELGGEGLSIRPGGVTMMACPAARMAQERAVLDSLATVTGFDVTQDGALELRAAGEVVLRARR